MGPIGARPYCCQELASIQSLQTIMLFEMGPMWPPMGFRRRQRRSQEGPILGPSLFGYNREPIEEAHMRLDV
jgi:hypothetical protein